MARFKLHTVALIFTVPFFGCGANPEQDGIDAANAICSCRPKVTLNGAELDAIEREMTIFLKTARAGGFSRSNVGNEFQQAKIRAKKPITDCMQKMESESRVKRAQYETNEVELNKYSFAKEAALKSCQMAAQQAKESETQGERYQAVLKTISWATTVRDSVRHNGSQ